jgi:hypothetical protein
MVDMPLPKLHYLIDKAREFDGEVAASGLEDGSNPSDDREVAVIEAGADNPAQAELRAALVSLDSDERAEVLALMWIGRGDFGGESWDEALAAARDALDARTVAYLMGTPMLGDLVEQGLAEVGAAED